MYHEIRYFVSRKVRYNPSIGDGKISRKFSINRMKNIEHNINGLLEKIEKFPSYSLENIAKL